MATATGVVGPHCMEESAKSEQEFVTVVSVGSQPAAAVENFVTVLSIGTEEKNDRQAGRDRANGPSDIHPEEQVEVFRLPGEPLGFGLKFEGGAKNAEKVKRLFVQSCAEQSPASRAKCSWGTIGEGDEVLSIDGVPVTHMSRLDCVRRLKESQLVIKLLIRCRGALRPEVVSAERKSPPECVAKSEKTPPELPSVPPPVPPRKLRQARGSADGEANPIPAKKTWNGSPKSSSGSSSVTDSPQSQSHGTNGKSASPKSANSIGNGSHGSPNDSARRSSHESSPEMAKSKQEPPEAMVYLDARSQDGSSTHGSTSDDTGSSMSTVVDRFSLSDRFSTVSTASTTSGGAAEQHLDRSEQHPERLDRSVDDHTDESRESRDVSRAAAFEQLERDFLASSSDYLLKRLASSEAVTHVESRGEPGALVERITAVVAPNTVLIEETLTLQPPLSFQDAPLSYGHETRPDLVYTADLAGDSSTHFRPIRDEAAIVERVNGESLTSVAPSLPARNFNHVNRIPVNQQKTASEVAQPICQASPKQQDSSLEIGAPILPPKPMPRKDIKSKRKRPPPPPPPPRREPPPPVPIRGQIESTSDRKDVTVVKVTNGESANPVDSESGKIVADVARHVEFGDVDFSPSDVRNELDARDDEAIFADDQREPDHSVENSPTANYTAARTNKVLEIIEMKKVKAFGEATANKCATRSNRETSENEDCEIVSPGRKSAEVVAAPREKKKPSELKRDRTISTEIEVEEEEETPSGSISENWQDAKERLDSSENGTSGDNSRSAASRSEGNAENSAPGKETDQPRSDDDDETYRSLDEIKEDLKSSETNGALSSSSDEDDEEENAAREARQREGDSTSDDSEDNGDDDYYWQSNLATIGEEEEISSLEYTNANKDAVDTEDKSSVRAEVTTETRGSSTEKNESTRNATTATDVTKPECVRRTSKDSVFSALDKKLGAQVNAGRMENCGGDQRLPPDGDEFPATYQEFAGCASEQYQYVATTTTTRSSAERSNVVTASNGARDCNNEIDETSSSMSSTSSSFVEKNNRSEPVKLLRGESIVTRANNNINNSVTAAKNTNNNNNSITTTTREKTSSYVRTTNTQQQQQPPLIESRISSQYITSSLKRETTGIPQPEIPPERRGSAQTEEPSEKRLSNSSYFTGSSSPRITKLTTGVNNCEPCVVVSEKTFEISGYYPKEPKVTTDLVVPDYPESPPPPLPLTGPPKPENVAVAIGKNISSSAESTPQRKFSLNGELWRQDDKSEKSVRDKIAMFSSQSSLENPLFPGQQPPGVAANIATNGRRLSKYKSSEDVFGDDKTQETREHFANIERTRSSVDLTDSRKNSALNEIGRSCVEEKYDAHRAPSLPKTLPPEEPIATRAPSYSGKMITGQPAVYQKTAPSVNEKFNNSAGREFAVSESNKTAGREFATSEFNRTAGREFAASDSNKSTGREFAASESNKTAGREFAASELNKSAGKNGSVKPVVPPRASCASSLAFTAKPSVEKDGPDVTPNAARSATLPSLARATSFSGETSYVSDLSQLATASCATGNGQISRTNSLASTFRRNSEDMRRQSLNQLIEQRRKGISKLRGLVIPEKNAVPVDKPIIDLPEIKSRDSILLHQVPKSSIQDKWGSQSSLASTASSASSPLKATTSFKMPAPQIMSKYSPAFKRKSLAVYGTASANSSATSTPPSTRRPSPTHGSHSPLAPEPPKSLESICSPTRSDYSFEYVTSSSVSPETGVRSHQRPGHNRKTRGIGDYDDSDNDSAVSSSQSSISRGFSPPTSPAPSERSSISSERSYHTSLIMEMPSRNYSAKDTATIRADKSHYIASNLMYSDNRAVYSTSERSSSGSSSSGSSGSSTGSSPNPRSPQPESNPPRNSQIPQRQTLKRSSSTETNCSSASSSTLTSGSQASAESLSRRVLKPQSVEAINRKNILASARCRSGRDLNGSPLIQRKFSDDEELPVSSLAQENGSCGRERRTTGRETQDVKIAYIEVTEILTEDEDSTPSARVQREEIEETARSVETTKIGKSTGVDLMEASNDLKMWVRSEAKALMAETPRRASSEATRVIAEPAIATAMIARTTPRSRSSMTLDEPRYTGIVDTWSKNDVTDSAGKSAESRRLKSSTNDDDADDDDDDAVVASSVNDDLLTTLTTKTRSRAPINLEDRSFARSSRQMSLEDILVGKAEPKLARAQSASVDGGVGSGESLQFSGSQATKTPPATLPRNYATRGNSKDSWTEDKSFVSKIPTLGRPGRAAGDEDAARLGDRNRNTRIPTQRPLDRRSASVTDMKKALEKTDATSSSSSSFGVTATSPIAVTAHHHHRFPSLDSSVEERTRLASHEPETERLFNGEQFGSISSLASSTSLISQQELAQLVEEASGSEDARGAHDVVVVLLHKENPQGSVGITLAGGVDCEAKEITVHRVLAHSVADKDGRVQRGDRILSINGRSTRGLNHRESLAVLKQPRSEVVLVVSRSRSLEEGGRLRARTDSVETIVEGSEACGTFDDTAWGPATRVAIFKDGAGLGFSLAGGRDSPLGDRPLVIKKIFTGGAAEKTAALTAGDQLLEVNGIDVTRMSRIEAWSLMKKLSDGEANLLVRHPATKSS